MYERFYQLRERPFALSPDPEYLYPSRVHREALDYLRYGVESQAGFVVITGEIGSGKTTLVQTLLRGLDSQTTVGRIVNTILEPRELLETIMIDFGLDPAGRSKPVMLRDLAQFLVDQRLAGRLVLLVIDEAQNLSLAALEELRMLSNLETEKSKLLQIVLVGQPNLRAKLGSPELEQFRQRITVSYHLEPLDADETARYINHRLRRAAMGAPLEFPRDVTDAVHARSRGIPRTVNVICDAALVFGYAEERHQIDGGLIREVLTELETTGVLPTDAGLKPPATRPISVAPGFSPASEQADAGLKPGARYVAPALPDAGLKPAPSFAAPGFGSAAQRSDAGLRPDVSYARPAAAAVLEDEADRRMAAVEKREEALRLRERELAEQRRVLAEEYRLLHAQRTAAAAPAAASVRVQVDDRRPAPEMFTAGSPEGLWTRVRRAVLGEPHPTVRREIGS